MYGNGLDQTEILGDPRIVCNCTHHRTLHVFRGGCTVKDCSCERYDQTLLRGIPEDEKPKAPGKRRKLSAMTQTGN